MSKTNGNSSTTDAQSTTDSDSLLADLDTLADTLDVSLESAAAIRNRVEAAVQLAQQALKRVNQLEDEQEAALVMPRNEFSEFSST